MSELSPQLLWWAQDPEPVQGNHPPQTNECSQDENKKPQNKIARRWPAANWV